LEEIMKRNYFPFGIALVVTVGCGFLLPGTSGAQTSETFPDVLGAYRGFSQSIEDPGLRGPVELVITAQSPLPDTDFSGRLTMGSLLPFLFAGKVDADGVFKFRGNGPAGSVTGTGKWQDLTRGGALVLATYKFTPRVGPTDQGKVDLLRNFTQPPPNQDMPPDIAGDLRGIFASSLSLKTGSTEWMIQQDRTEAGTPGTGFMGQEARDMGTAGIIIYDFVGTIDGQGNFVRIGSARGIMPCEMGGNVQLGALNAHSAQNFSDGGVDLVSVTLRQVR
jgi:hypothetical protein